MASHKPFLFSASKFHRAYAPSAAITLIVYTARGKAPRRSKPSDARVVTRKPGFGEGEAAKRCGIEQRVQGGKVSDDEDNLIRQIALTVILQGWRSDLVGPTPRLSRV